MPCGVLGGLTCWEEYNDFTFDDEELLSYCTHISVSSVQLSKVFCHGVPDVCWIRISPYYMNVSFTAKENQTTVLKSASQTGTCCWIRLGFTSMLRNKHSFCRDLPCAHLARCSCLGSRCRRQCPSCRPKCPCCTNPLNPSCSWGCRPRNCKSASDRRCQRSGHYSLHSTFLSSGAAPQCRLWWSLHSDAHMPGHQRRVSSF